MNSKITIIIILAIAFLIVLNQSPSIAADALLHPMRRQIMQSRPDGCKNVSFLVDKDQNLNLRGWECEAITNTQNLSNQNIGTIIYLHGVADNRTVATGIIPRFTAKGFKVIAYDSRAHGESDGKNCTYGYYEKADLQSILNIVGDSGKQPIILMGNSMGAAVALQAGANDPRILGIVAAESFSDLRTIVRDRTPPILTDDFLNQGFAIAEERGKFVADEVSPINAAERITASVLLIHGADDYETRPEHSQRIFTALNSSKEIIFVKGKGHNQSLDNDEIWQKIEQWVSNLAL
jgi:alpha-beta hydrolase superfamily lysophospholipase